MTAPAVSQGSDEFGNPQALTDGSSAAFLGAAGIAVVGGVLALVLLTTPGAPLAPEEPVEGRDEPEPVRA